MSLLRGLVCVCGMFLLRAGVPDVFLLISVEYKTHWSSLKNDCGITQYVL